MCGNWLEISLLKPVVPPSYTRTLSLSLGTLTYQIWEEHWTYQTGDGELTWGPDPELTPLGHEQTKAVHTAWVAERAAGAPVNKDTGEIRWFCSPLQRTCQTMVNSWGDMLGVPEVWEVSPSPSQRESAPSSVLRGSVAFSPAR